MHNAPAVPSPPIDTLCLGARAGKRWRGQQGSPTPQSFKQQSLWLLR